MQSTNSIIKTVLGMKRSKVGLIIVGYLVICQLVSMCIKTHLSISLEKVVVIVCGVGLIGLLYRYIAVEKENCFFDEIIERRYILALFLFIFMLIFSINGFSLSIWDRYITSSEASNILLGKGRDITSDTWALAIPSIFNQVKNGFPIYNTDIMTNGVNTLVMGLPALDITMLGRPFMWGYIFLGEEVGLAWHYYLKFFILFLSSYEVCRYFARGNKRLAGVFAVVIGFSPAIQWWFGQTIIDTIIHFQVCLAALILYMENIDDLKKKIFWAIIFFMGGISFILTMYPPLQVPLGYLFLIIAVNIIVEHNKSINLSKSDLCIGGILMVCVAAIVTRYLLLTADGMKLLAQTAYPGQRVEVGGTYNLQNIYYYFMQWALPYKGATFSNNCEVSAIIPFLPMILLVFPFVIYKRREYFHVVLFMYEIFLISWLFIQYPLSFAKYTMFSYVTANRLTLIIGLISIYLALIAFTELKEKDRLSKGQAMGIGGVTCLITSLFLFGYDGGGYFDVLRGIKIVPIMMSIGFFTIFTVIFARGYKRLMPLLLIGMIFVSGMTINPICIGSGTLMKSSLAQQIMKIENESPNKLWVFDEKFPYSNYLLTYGVRAFNTLNSYPDYEKWHKIDPTGELDEIYNRYAHVGVTLSNEKTNVELTAPDAIVVNLNEHALRVLDVEYIVSQNDIKNGHFEVIYKDNDSNMKIYKVK